MMLAPLRNQALRPAQLIARLALSPRSVIADVGAGPGFLTLPLAHAVPKGRVVATDIRADYLALTASRARSEKLRNVETLVVKADDPGLPKQSFDLIVLCQLDHYLSDRTRYFSALRPALRDKGRIAIVNYLRYRAADLAAARAASLHVVDEWSPSPPFFLLVLAPDPPARN